VLLNSQNQNIFLTNQLFLTLDSVKKSLFFHAAITFFHAGITFFPAGITFFHAGITFLHAGITFFHIGDTFLVLQKNFEISRILICCTLIYMFRAGAEFF
jgi:hypothetical protein